jgi:hypothetical protein
MPKFKTEEARLPFIPAGDYIFCVREFEIGLSNGGKTAGSEKYELTLEIEGKGHTVYENLIDHPSTGWKINTFLKCTGVRLNEGESFEFSKDSADANEVRWVNPIGLRGHCAIIVDEYTAKDGTKKKRNNLASFYTDRAKLPPNESLRGVEEEKEEGRPF